MSKIAKTPSRPVLVAAYGLLATIIAFELAVTWFALHPNVSDDYRAYYITQTTTCLNQPVSGAYTLGQTVSFLPEGRAAAKPIKVCGWEGPVGDGTHALGDSTRLRFVFAEPSEALKLTLSMIAIANQTQPTQTVRVVVNGTALDDLTVTSTSADAPEQFTIAIPADIAQSNSGHVEVTLDLITAVRLAPTDSSTRKRSIKLQSVRLENAGA